VNFIAVLPTVPKTADISALLEVIEDTLHTTLGNTDDLRNLPSRHAAPITTKAQENLSVISEKRPSAHAPESPYLQQYYDINPVIQELTASSCTNESGDGY
jgi:hypothetical protein